VDAGAGIAERADARPARRVHSGNHPGVHAGVAGARQYAGAVAVEAGIVQVYVAVDESWHEVSVKWILPRVVGLALICTGLGRSVKNT
jgi:hypothetical protein